MVVVGSRRGDDRIGEGGWDGVGEGDWEGQRGR